MSDRVREFEPEFTKAKYASKRAEEFLARGEHLRAASYFAKAAFEAELARTVAAKTAKNHERANKSSVWERRAVECLMACGARQVEFWSSGGPKMVLDLDEMQTFVAPREVASEGMRDFDICESWTKDDKTGEPVPRLRLSPKGGDEWNLECGMGWGHYDGKSVREWIIYPHAGFHSVAEARELAKAILFACEWAEKQKVSA